MIVKVDAQDFVISVEPEAVESASREIQRSEAVPEATQICKGPWHYKAGKGTARPLSAFSMSTRSGSAGMLNKTCDECLHNTKKAGHVAGKNLKPRVHIPPLPERTGVNKIEHALAAATPDSQNGTGGLMHKWEVTIETVRVVTVYAKDYLDAGVEAGEGDVINVRRLD